MLKKTLFINQNIIINIVIKSFKWTVQTYGRRLFLTRAVMITEAVLGLAQ